MQGLGHKFNFRELGAVCQADNWRLRERKYGEFSGFTSRDCALNEDRDAVYANVMADSSGRYRGA